MSITSMKAKAKLHHTIQYYYLTAKWEVSSTGEEISAFSFAVTKKSFKKN